MTVKHGSPNHRIFTRLLRLKELGPTYWVLDGHKISCKRKDKEDRVRDNWRKNCRKIVGKEEKS